MLPQLIQALVLIRLDRGLLMVRFMRSTMQFVQGVCLSMSFLDAIELADPLTDVTDACVGNAAYENFPRLRGRHVRCELSTDSATL